MSGKRYTAEQIIVNLRQAEIMVGQGRTVDEAVRELGVTKNTYYRWRQAYGGLKLDQARRMKELEGENARLKRAVAELTVDNQILKEVTKGKF